MWHRHVTIRVPAHVVIIKDASLHSMATYMNTYATGNPTSAGSRTRESVMFKVFDRGTCRSVNLSLLKKGKEPKCSSAKHSL